MQRLTVGLRMAVLTLLSGLVVWLAAPGVWSQAPSLAFISSSTGAVPWVGSTAGVPTVSIANNTLPRVLSTGAQITAASGTGITVNNAGELRPATYVVTIARTALVCAAVTCDVTIGTLPAKTFLVHALADLTQAFACTGTCTSSTLSITLGKTAGGTQYLVSFDADAAAGQFGDAAAELGASLTEATIPTAIGDLGSWSATTAVSMRFTSGTGNIGNGSATNLSQGSVTFYLTTVVQP
jgi:hypothetical protein